MIVQAIPGELEVRGCVIVPLINGIADFIADDGVKGDAGARIEQVIDAGRSGAAVAGKGFFPPELATANFVITIRKAAPGEAKAEMSVGAKEAFEPHLGIQVNGS